ncbi:tetratricopeptide repeat protein [Tenacibaculum sp. SG-28]|uniref:tetratricopeptide repeat protein n=1 Tax=Tenacibaculum sp. SG-28 TaxID=754426 RepID=UPI000CF49F31|nr:tetratricopeptide repeat protein [Tenacibaculum sp. SG-28]PQJ21040.1 hypothetical protein BSU00_08435 [Tenacibaculum sp. SG-28]
MHSPNSNQLNDSLAYKNYALGNLYVKNHLHAKAIQYYTNAITATTVDTFHINIKNAIGNIYLDLENYPIAEKYINEALILGEKETYESGMANSYLLLGASKEKQGRYLEAIKNQEKALQWYTKMQDKIGVANSKINIGSIYEDLNQFDKAYNYFLEAYAILKNTQTAEECDVLNNLGDVYRKRGDIQAAISYTNHSLDIAKALENSNLIESAYKDLSKAYFDLEEYRKAYEYRVKSEIYKEITTNKQNTKQLNFLLANYDSNTKEAEIKLLKESNKLKKTHQNILIALLIVLLSYSIVARYIFQKKRKAKLKIQQYKEQILKSELEQKQVQQTILERDIKSKTASLSKYSLHLSQKNTMLQEISSNLNHISKRKNIDVHKKITEVYKEIDFHLKQDNEWEDFNTLFKDIHPDFTINLQKATSQKLSPSELKLSMLLRLNLSSKEIATILRVTPDSIRVARYRLRKKLPIHPREELVNFMHNF